MNAEIIAIGDEITSGQSLDTNSQWLSQRLEELGVRVLYHSTVGDELTPGVEVFRHAIGRADVVVATGGLGPTADDLTREALAQATGRPLHLDADVLASIRERFARWNRPMPASNELQAMFPAGSRVVRNPHGTAPGIDLEVARDGTVPIFVPAKIGLSPLTRPTPCRIRPSRASCLARAKAARRRAAIRPLPRRKQARRDTGGSSLRPGQSPPDILPPSLRRP